MNMRALLFVDLGDSSPRSTDPLSGRFHGPYDAPYPGQGRNGRSPRGSGTVSAVASLTGFSTSENWTDNSRSQVRGGQRCRESYPIFSSHPYSTRASGRWA